jgi:hypothetical protein
LELPQCVVGQHAGMLISAGSAGAASQMFKVQGLLLAPVRAMRLIRSDLRPVCRNCHAMLHRGTDVLSIDDLRQIIESRL